MLNALYKRWDPRICAFTRVHKMTAKVSASAGEILIYRNICCITMPKLPKDIKA